MEFDRREVFLKHEVTKARRHEGLVSLKARKGAKTQRVGKFNGLKRLTGLRVKG
jgi:hypothetical protein